MAVKNLKCEELKSKDWLAKIWLSQFGSWGPLGQTFIQSANMNDSTKCYICSNATVTSYAMAQKDISYHMSLIYYSQDIPLLASAIHPTSPETIKTP